MVSRSSSITINDARKILGSDANAFTDEEIADLIMQIEFLSEIAISNLVGVAAESSKMHVGLLHSRTRRTQS